MEIRKVNFEEVEGVLELIDEYDRPKAEWPSNEQIASIYSSICENGGCIVGAYIDNCIVGTCTLNLCANLSWSGRPYAIIENVIVSKGYRNQGVGKALLCFAKNTAQELGCYKVALMTGSKQQSTLQFYESAGFVGNKIGYQTRFNA